MATTQFLLGANSPTGFYSLYDELIDRDTARSVYILKGGPGCGKSSLMRRVGKHAQAAGLTVQYIVCSGDPDSLDAVILPELNAALVDGTAPHVVEPACPGVVDHYVDLGRHYDADALQPQRSEILTRMEENRSAYRRCYRCLAAVGALESDVRELLLAPELTARLVKRAKGIIGRELKRGGGQAGRVTQRFLSAVTCKGQMTLWETVDALCSRVYELCDSYGLAHELLSPIAAAACARGWDVIVCPSPLAPDRMEHLLIPALGLAFVRSTGEQPYPGRAHRRLRLDHLFSSSEIYRRSRSRLRFSRRVSSALLEEAMQALAQAKTAHDALEALYNPYVDFEGVYADADALAAQLIPGGVTASPQ